MNQHWQQLPERGSAFSLRLIIWIGLRLGRRVGRLLLYPIVGYFLITISPEVRQGSRDYLRRAIGPEVGFWHFARHMHCYACSIFDRVFLLADRLQHFRVEVHNGTLVTEQLSNGRGCLLLGAHLGSFEVLRAVGSQRRQLPIKILMDVDHSSVITTALAELNPQLADAVIPLRGPESLLKVKESLDQGFLVGILGDRVGADGAAATKTAACRFFDANAEFPTGPLMLAAALHCPVILGFSLLRGNGRYDIYFERFAERFELPREPAARASELQRGLQRYANRLEHYARSAPYNWFNFYRYWG